MKDLILNVYDRSGNVVKTCEAGTAELEFGTIRSIMELLNIESVQDTSELLKTVYNAWDDLTMILNRCFPDMEYEDWEHVRLKELIPLTVEILRYSFSEILTIPGDEKN